MIVTEGIAQHHLGATAEQYLRRSPSKLIVDFMWSWAQEQSSNVFHLGGGVGGAEDSLFHFKAGFSSARAEFYTYRIIVCHERNRILKQAIDFQSSSSDPEQSAFFPGYRHVKRPIHSP